MAYRRTDKRQSIPNNLRATFASAVTAICTSRYFYGVIMTLRSAAAAGYGTFRRVGTMKCIETPDGTLATGRRRAPPAYSLFASPVDSLGGARVCRLSSAAEKHGRDRQTGPCRRLRSGKWQSIERRNRHGLAEDVSSIYRTLADIPCRPGFVCTTSVRYNRSSALQVYSQCALD